jgi:hypothetical protein
MKEIRGGSEETKRGRRRCPPPSVLGAVRLRAAGPSQCSRDASREGRAGVAFDGSRDADDTAPEEPCRRSILCPRSSAAVEHESEAESAACTPPDFVGEEVTFDVRYTGYALAQPLSIDRR